ncbi:MAG: rhodanese-like domain-containing protein [Proteobacteria bacterium]|nr:rhodanese-like domain-containing protein [Pseudomonadota bacterium]
MKLKRTLSGLTPLLLTLCLLLFSTGAGAATNDRPTPEVLTGGKIVTAPALRSLIKGGTVTVIDVRNPINFGRGHIPTAVSLPYSGKVEKSDTFVPAPGVIDFAQLPVDKAAPILVYSHGPTGWKSYLAALVAINLGHTNVMWLRGGYSSWTESGFSVARGR